MRLDHASSHALSVAGGNAGRAERSRAPAGTSPSLGSVFAAGLPDITGSAVHALAAQLEGFEVARGVTRARSRFPRNRGLTGGLVQSIDRLSSHLVSRVMQEPELLDLVQPRETRGRLATYAGSRGNGR
jgi:hypothetical protein